MSKNVYEITKKQYVCSRCNTEYDTLEEAEKCFEYGQAVKTLLACCPRWSWYHITPKYGQESFWSLIDIISIRNHGVGACTSTKIIMYEAGKNGGNFVNHVRNNYTTEYSEIDFINHLSIEDGYKKHGLIPNIITSNLGYSIGIEIKRAITSVLEDARKKELEYMNYLSKTELINRLKNDMHIFNYVVPEAHESEVKNGYDAYTQVLIEEADKMIKLVSEVNTDCACSKTETEVNYLDKLAAEWVEALGGKDLDNDKKN